MRLPKIHRRGLRLANLRRHVVGLERDTEHGRLVIHEKQFGRRRGRTIEIDGVTRVALVSGLRAGCGSLVRLDLADGECLELRPPSGSRSGCLKLAEVLGNATQLPLHIERGVRNNGKITSVGHRTGQHA